MGATKSEKGEASVYLAAGIALTLIMLFFFGAADVSELYRLSRAVDRARNAGILQAEIDGGLSPEAQNRIWHEIRAEGLDPGLITLEGSPVGVPWGGRVFVRLTYQHRFHSVMFDQMAGLVRWDRSILLGGTTWTTSGLAP
jgi:hypothetical protein